MGAAPKTATNSAAAARAGGKPPAAPGATVRALLATDPAPKAPSFATLDIVSLCELATNVIETGSFTAKVPMRQGTVRLPLLAGEPIELTVPSGAVATITASLQASPNGPVLSDMRVSFSPNALIVENPSVVVSDSALLRAAASLITIKVDGVTLDARGQLGITGTASRTGLLGFEKRLEDFIPRDKLPRFDMSLTRLLGVGRAPGLPNLPGPDPRKLVCALGGAIERASFELKVSGKGRSLGVAGDGAEIISKEGKSSIHLAGDVVPSGEGTLDGKVTGTVNGPLATTLEIGESSASASAGGLTVKHENSRIVVSAGGLDVVKAVAGQVAVLIGERIDVDAEVAASLTSGVRLAFGQDGALSVRASDVEAKLALTDARAESSRLSVKLGEPSSVHFRVAEITAGSSGVVVRDLDGGLDLRLEHGSMELAGAKLAVDGGSVAVTARHDVDVGNASIRYDIPTSAAINGGTSVKTRMKGDIDVEIAQKASS